MIRRLRYGLFGKGKFPSDNLAPTNLTAEASDTGILVSWDDNSGNETGYQVERSTDEENFELIHTTIPNVTSYDDTDESLEVETYYYYRVRAVFSDSYSDYSNTQGTLLNQIDEALLDVNNIYLTTEEGYLMVEEDNKNNIIIQED